MDLTAAFTLSSDKIPWRINTNDFESAKSGKIFNSPQGYRIGTNLLVCPIKDCPYLEKKIPQILGDTTTVTEVGVWSGFKHKGGTYEFNPIIFDFYGVKGI